MKKIFYIIICFATFSAFADTVEITCKDSHTYEGTDYTNERIFIVEKNSVNAELRHTTIGYKNKEKVTDNKEHISLKAKWLPTKIIFSINEGWHIYRYVIDRGNLTIYNEDEAIGESPVMKIERELYGESSTKIGDIARNKYKNPCTLKVNTTNNQF